MSLALALLIALAAPATAAAASDRWQPPVKGAVLREFALSADRYGAGQHRGVDLAAPLGATVRAACGGRVTFAGTVPGGGRTVSVRCGRLIATYQHLGAFGVRRGQALAPGSPLGVVGRSIDRRTRRAHLHLGAREARTGRYVDPLSLLTGARRRLPPIAAARAPARRHLPLGPAPVTPVARPVSLRAPAAVPARAPSAVTPWTVWLGLVCVGLGLPLGGLVAVRRRRLRATYPLARPAS